MYKGIFVNMPTCHKLAIIHFSLANIHILVFLMTILRGGGEIAMYPLQMKSCRGISNGVSFISLCIGLVIYCGLVRLPPQISREEEM